MEINISYSGQYYSIANKIVFYPLISEGLHVTQIWKVLEVIRGEVLNHKAILTPRRVIEVYVPNKESE